MFTPQKLEEIPLGLQKIFSKLEQDIMLDIVRRVAENGQVTRTADYQINRLHELSVSKRVIKKYIQEALKLSKKEINHIYKDAIRRGYSEDASLYRVTGKPFVRFENNEELQQAIRAIKNQTENKLYNLTNSTGFIKNDNGKRVFTPLTRYYQDVLDKNVSGILNGAIDYNTAIKNTVQEMTKSGLRTIDYASGKSFRIESAVRTALMTGVNQIAAKISDENAEKLGTEYFEVSAHGTARPSHQVWQGKVYKKDELESVCGLGKVDGLCGANCRHSYYPFIPGVSVRKYTDEQLEEWANKENTPKKYGDKEYTSYEASQEQRKLERLMRKQRQDIKLLKEGGANEEDIMVAETKYRITSDEYVKLSKVMGLPQQRERVYSDGLKEVSSKEAYKTIEHRANLYYNGDVKAYLKHELIRKNIRANVNYNTIHWGKQDKHIKGTNNYIENRSYFTINREEIEKIALTNKGTGYIFCKNGDDSFNGKEKVVLDRIIGHYIKLEKEENKIIEEYDTNSIIIQYGKDGIHIVPGGR